MKLETVIFCDGACSGNPGPGGWGAIVAAGDQVLELGGRDRATTNNKMELRGAIEALRAIGSVTGEALVYTDSVYVINGITKWIFGWMRNGWKSSQGGEVQNQELWKELHAVVSARGKGNPIRWHYVRGHAAVAGNERVDAIAVAFSQGESPSLYRGRRDGYGISLDPGELETLPMKSTKKAKSGPSVYLSLVGPLAMKHATWAECERRVKGQANAKFKKVTSAAEEEQVWREWGVDPSRVK